MRGLMQATEKRVLVTGATGFVGRQCLAPLLERGFEVHAVQWGPELDAGDDIHWHPSNLLDADAVRSLIKEVAPSHLLHGAWYVEPGAFWTSPANLQWVQASIDLMQAFQEGGGQRAVMVGTCAEYDWGHEVLRENDTPCRPSTLYGACKFGLYTMLRAYAEQTGLSAAWGRLFLMYGPHEYPNRLVSGAIRAMLQGEDFPCSHGKQVRDLMHVADVGGALAALVASDVEGPVNIASGQPTTLRAVLEEVSRLCGDVERVQFGARPASPGEPATLTADVSRLTGEIGWQSHYDLNQGLADAVAWWRDELAAEQQGLK